MHLPSLAARLRNPLLVYHRAVYRGMLLGLLAIGWAVPASAAPDRFEQLRARDLRVATVAYRLSVANRPLCGHVLAPQLGFVLHGIEQYAPADREQAARSLGLGSQVGVMAVVTGSPAQRAGLGAGDQLLSVNGHELGGVAPGVVPTRSRVEQTQQMIEEEMRAGHVMLRVRAGGIVRVVQFDAESGCATNVELVPGDAVNAWADGTHVMVSDGLLARCATDDDLALVIGHEMAHNLLHHRQRLAAEGISANSLLPATAGASRAMQETEEEADRLAVGLAMAAAYDLGYAEPFLSGLLDHAAPVAATHPAPTQRLALLRAAIADARRGRLPMALPAA
jgi:Zn-dependent protease with chaperone function